MTKIPRKIETWQMVAPGKMERATIDVPELKPGEVLVEIAGCGICHSDHTAFYGGVPTVTPRTLGHNCFRIVAFYRQAGSRRVRST